MYLGDMDGNTLWVLEGTYSFWQGGAWAVSKFVKMKLISQMTPSDLIMSIPFEIGLSFGRGSSATAQKTAHI